MQTAAATPGTVIIEWQTAAVAATVGGVLVIIDWQTAAEAATAGLVLHSSACHQLAFITWCPWHAPFNTITMVNGTICTILRFNTNMYANGTTCTTGLGFILSYSPPVGTTLVLLALGYGTQLVPLWYYLY